MVRHQQTVETSGDQDAAQWQHCDRDFGKTLTGFSPCWPGGRLLEVWQHIGATGRTGRVSTVPLRQCTKPHLRAQLRSNSEEIEAADCTSEWHFTSKSCYESNAVSPAPHEKFITASHSGGTSGAETMHSWFHATPCTTEQHDACGAT